MIAPEYEPVWQWILNDEGMYARCVNWMGQRAESERRHTYVENGKVWHKNASELSADGYFDRYIEENLERLQTEIAKLDGATGRR